MNKFACGSWPSMIGVDSVLADTRRLQSPQFWRGQACWAESRPEEKGRTSIMGSTPEGATVELLAAPFSARTKIQEYGGQSFWVAGEALIFSNQSDQRLYRLLAGETPVAITPEGPFRYADVVALPQGGYLAVRESRDQPGEPRSEIVYIGEDCAVMVWVTGADFYASIAVNEPGDEWAYLSWSHPQMPWQGTQLWRGSLTDAGPGEVHWVAGSSSESIFQPSWSPGGQLCFVSDRSGWWNLYLQEGDVQRCLLPEEAEYAWPQWVFGMKTYAWWGDRRLVVARQQQGCWQWGELDVSEGIFKPLLSSSSLDLTVVDAVAVSGNQCLCLGANACRDLGVYLYQGDLHELRLLRSSVASPLPAAWVSTGQCIHYQNRRGGQVQAWFYAPSNPDRSLDASRGELPPLIVWVHGGPTAAVDNGLDRKLQFWTSRGFAVVVPNYRGSTGFGRHFRQQLNGAWGVADVEDCIDVARHCAAKAWVDGDRMVIRGSSSGGLTVLRALMASDVFAAGVSYYGVTDLVALAEETHKFEAHYCDTLVGKFPQERELYEQRSAVTGAEHIAVPVAFFQGEQDAIVPPSQSLAMLARLQARGIDCLYRSYAEEGHGFRQYESQKDALLSEEAFYQRVLCGSAGASTRPENDEGSA